MNIGPDYYKLITFNWLFKYIYPHFYKLISVNWLSKYISQCRANIIVRIYIRARRLLKLFDLSFVQFYWTAWHRVNLVMQLTVKQYQYVIYVAY